MFAKVLGSGVHPPPPSIYTTYISECKSENVRLIYEAQTTILTFLSNQDVLVLKQVCVRERNNRDLFLSDVQTVQVCS